MSNEYDLIIIGAGPGGYEAAIYASKNNLKTLLIEKEQIGGVCLNEGCIPTKSYYALAAFKKQAETFRNLYSSDILLDWKVAVFRKRKIVEDLRSGIKQCFDSAKVDLLYGDASFKSDNVILVDDKSYFAKNIIIATGSKDNNYFIKGYQNCITSATLLDMINLPKNICIIGGGVIGVELATILNSFKVRVTIIEKTDSILQNLDLDVKRRITTYLKQAGIQIICNASIIDVNESKQIKYNYKDKTDLLTFDEVIISIGREPNIYTLNLGVASVEYNNKGIIVDDSFQTTKNNIYAIGDCIGKVMLAHYATAGGIYVVDRILKKENKTNFSIIPSVVFTIPEIATVGLKENEVESCSLKKITYRVSGLANAVSAADGFIKLVIKNNLIVGASIIGYNASSLIHEIIIIMNAKININNIKSYIFAHPTISELLKDCILQEEVVK